MPYLIQFTKVLWLLISIATLAACAHRGPDPQQSLLKMKERLVDAKKDPDLQRESAQFIYEADLYWQRAWTARNDAAEANHLLFMVQGKLAMAQSVFALRKAEDKVKQGGSTQHIKREKRPKLTASNNGSVKSIAVATERDSNLNTPGAEAKFIGAKSQVVNVQGLDFDGKQTNSTPVETSTSPSEKDTKGRSAIEAENLRDETIATIDREHSFSISADDFSTVPNTSVVDRKSNVARQTRLEPPYAIHTATPLQSEDEQSKRRGESNSSDPNKDLTIRHATPFLEEDNRLNDEPEETIIGKGPNKPLEENGKSATAENSHKLVRLNEFRVDIAAYCRGITAMIKDNGRVEQKCKELEIAAKMRLETLQSHTALSKLQSHAIIFKYCGDVSRVLGAGYQIMELCVEQEMGSDPDNRNLHQGYVMEDPNSPGKNPTKNLGP